MKIHKDKARIMTAVATLLVASYIVVSLLIVVPNKAITAPFSAVTSATSPMLEQNWRLFAPNILKVSNYLQVQAQWRDDSGDLITSEWINITEIEQRSVAGHLTPSRINKSSWNAIRTYQTRYAKLNTEQKEVIRSSFVTTDDDGNDGAQSRTSISAELTAFDSNTSQIGRVLNYDALLVQYTGVFASVFLDRRVDQVRWRHERVKANDFTERFSDIQQHSPTATTYGWRYFGRDVTADERSVYKDVLTRYGALK